MKPLLLAAAFAVAVIDGDTLDWNGHRWRLAAIDTPERGEPLYSAARNRLEALSRDGLRCRDTGEKPSHGRLIGVCHGPAGDVALILVTEGLAAVCHQRPLAAPYVAAEQAARSASRGIWATSYKRKDYCRG